MIYGAVTYCLNLDVKVFRGEGARYSFRPHWQLVCLSFDDLLQGRKMLGTAADPLNGRRNLSFLR